ncbi:MAG: hypothetical protein WD058_09295 [Dehalococcoidia bacterium]
MSSVTPDVFDEIVLLGDPHLDTDVIGDIFRASLLAGAACSRSAVTRVPLLRDAWDEENRVGAALLTEFWSAVIAARLLGRVEERDALLDQVAELFARTLFGSNAAALRWALETFEAQLALTPEEQALAATDANSGGMMTWFFLAWQSRDLLAGDLPLRGRYFPAQTLDAWLADPRHEGVSPSPDAEAAVLSRDILLWGLEAAGTHFEALRAAAEEREREAASADDRTNGDGDADRPQ